MPLVNIIKNPDKKDFKDNLQAAGDRLNTIIANHDTLTVAQRKQAIGDIALYMKKTIKFAATRVG